jgi:hypothetical protein
MNRFAALIALTVLTVSPLAAQDKTTPAPDVTGKWTMTVHPDPHGMTMGLVLEQKGTKVTGTFNSPHGDIAVEGEFVDGQLTLATEGDTDSRITFNARLKTERTLAGYLSSPMGDMEWTAERAPRKTPKATDSH